MNKAIREVLNRFKATRDPSILTALRGEGLRGFAFELIDIERQAIDLRLLVWQVTDEATDKGKRLEQRKLEIFEEALEKAKAQDDV